MKTKISLVLGSGGARGMAHIGIIKWLEENDYEIISISGCSMGALIGGFYAANKLDIFTNWLRDLDVLSMLKLLDFKGSGGLVAGKKLMNTLEALIGDYEIQDLSINFTAVATDITNEKEVWINSGSLLKAIRSSISLPLFFTPYPYRGTHLIDGGVLNPVPIAPTFRDHSDLTIAVNLGAEIDNSLHVKKETNTPELMSQLKKYFSKVALPQSIKEKHSMYKIADSSFDTMQNTIARMKLAAYPPDIEIQIPRNLCGTLEFNLADEIIEYGYNACEKKLGIKTNE